MKVTIDLCSWYMPVAVTSASALALTWAVWRDNRRGEFGQGLLPLGVAMMCLPACVITWATWALAVYMK